MPEDVIELPAHGDAAEPADAAGEAGHAASFKALCHHLDLRISRYKLVDMVKVAAQERFLRLLDDDFTGLHYSHRLKLTALPNNEIKIDMAKECVDENLTTRQLGYRIRRRVAEMAPAREEPGAEGEGETPTPGREPDPAAEVVNAFIAALDQLTRQAAALNPEPLEPHLDNLPPEIRGSLEYRLTTVSDALEATRMMCQHLLHRLRPGDPEH